MSVAVATGWQSISCAPYLVLHAGGEGDDAVLGLVLLEESLALFVGARVGEGHQTAEEEALQHTCLCGCEIVRCPVRHASRAQKTVAFLANIL